MNTKTLLVAAAAIMLSTAACNQQQNAAPGADAVRVSTTATNTGNRAHGRFVGSQYSKSMSLDTANRMISSYLQSVGFPTIDSAVRSLAFDADTLRAYLSNTNITSLEFFLAHQQAYLNADASRFGINIGMRPGALTVICVGYDDDGNLVRNSSNGVYEHAMPCPFNCPSSVSNGFLQ